jgi:hypothetical protein
MVIPVKMSDTKTKTIRDIIGDISESVFGSLIQTNDFELAFNILSPSRNLDDKKFTEADVLEFSINSDSSKLIKTASVNYLFKEYDYLAGSGTNLNEEITSNENLYLQQSTKLEIFDSKLVKESEAETLSERFSLVLQLARATVTIKTKLQAARLSVNDRVWVSHEKLYERIGSIFNQKVGAIESVRKSGSNSMIEVEDLSGTFSRCGTVTENTALEFDLSSNDDKIINGFITDTYGMIDNEQDTFGTNLIW